MAHRNSGGLLVVVIANLFALNTAGAVPVRPCRTVASCMAQAAREPASFSATLHSSLSGLSVPALISSLTWTHERVEVTQRGRLLIALAISESSRTLDERSAQRLFDAAKKAENNVLSTWWLDLSGRTARGHRRLGECFDELSSSSFGLRCGLHYLNRIELERRLKAYVPGRQSVSIDSSREEHVVEAVWQAYLKIRRGTSLASSDDAAFDVDRYARRQVLVLDFFAGRLEQLVRSELDAGTAPPEEELEKVIARHAHDSSIKADLLRWSESSVSEVRLLAFQLWWKHASSTTISDEDVARARCILLTLATDPLATSVVNVPVLLEALQRGVTPADAVRFVKLTDLSDSDPQWLSLLASHADEFQPCRDALAKRLLGPDLDVAQRAADVVYKSQALQQFVRRLILAVNAADLRDEDVQERLLVWASVVVPNEGQLLTGAALPPSRRGREARGTTNFCGYVGRTPSRWERDQQLDLEAFGLRPKSPPPPPPPASDRRGAAPASPRPRISAARPMLSPEEKVERWETFVRGLQRLQRKLGGHAR